MSRHPGDGDTGMTIGTAIMNLSLNPLIALAVFGATIVTDAVFVFFTAAVASRHRFRAANWSAVWYLLAAVSVISYTSNPVYVVFAALGSWVGAYMSVTWLNRGQAGNAAIRPGPP
jgi:uncharacterized membrane protein YhaH (DUF805 family)